MTYVCVLLIEHNGRRIAGAVGLGTAVCVLRDRGTLRIFSQCMLILGNRVVADGGLCMIRVDRGSNDSIQGV
jgi:hypothetical protein